METAVATSVDPSALWSAARHLDAAADLLHGALTGHLQVLRFDADVRVRAAVDQLVRDVVLWQQAVRETAAALRGSAERYLDAESRAAESLR